MIDRLPPHSLEAEQSVLGAMLEENFISSMIKAEGSLVAFFERPIAGALGLVALAVLTVPLWRRLLRAAP